MRANCLKPRSLCCMSRATYLVREEALKIQETSGERCYGCIPQDWATLVLTSYIQGCVFKNGCWVALACKDRADAYLRVAMLKPCFNLQLRANCLKPLKLVLNVHGRVPGWQDCSNRVLRIQRTTLWIHTASAASGALDRYLQNLYSTLTFL